MTYQLLLVCVAMVFVACNRQKMDRRISFWRGDKIPYGTYYAYQSLSHIFPGAKIETAGSSPETLSENDSAAVYLVIGRRVMPSSNELRALLQQVYLGNKLFIAAYELGDNLLDSLGMSVPGTGSFGLMDSTTIHLVEEESGDSSSFTYPGFRLETWFSKIDSTYTHVLGVDRAGRPNFVRFDFESGGQIFVHLAPAAFTNFFLLHKENKRFYDLVMSHIRDEISIVRWDDYFRTHINGHDVSKKYKLSELLNNEALRWAFWLTILLFAIIWLFESKRHQRVIPLMKRPANSSLDFVQTVGQLYYQRRDNKNLAQKMITHFLSHVRSVYNLPTTELSEEFAKRLSYKTGSSLEEIRDLLYTIKFINDHPSLSDEDLLTFSDKLDKFYKRA